MTVKIFIFLFSLEFWPSLKHSQWNLLFFSLSNNLWIKFDLITWRIKINLWSNPVYLIPFFFFFFTSAHIWWEKNEFYHPLWVQALQVVQQYSTPYGVRVKHLKEFTFFILGCELFLVQHSSTHTMKERSLLCPEEMSQYFMLVTILFTNEIF